MLVPISIQNRSFDLLLFEAGVPRAETAIAADHLTAAGLEGVKDAIFSYAVFRLGTPGSLMPARTCVGRFKTCVEGSNNQTANQN
jgi:hypothetical protein